MDNLRQKLKEFFSNTFLGNGWSNVNAGHVSTYTPRTNLRHYNSLTPANHTVYYDTQIHDEMLDVSGVDPDELRQGIQQEFKSVRDIYLAKKIALDNIAQDPKYYSSLSKYFQDQNDDLKTPEYDRGMGFTTASPDSSTLKPSLKQKYGNDLYNETVIQKLKEACYTGNCKFMEIFEFMKIATKDEIRRFHGLLRSDNVKDAMKLVQKVTKMPLKGAEFGEEDLNFIPQYKDFHNIVNEEKDEESGENFKKVKCKSCDGQGGEPAPPYSARPFIKCDVCNGKGYIKVLDKDLNDEG